MKHINIYKNNQLHQQLINPTLIKYLQFINNDLLNNHDKTYINLHIISIKIINDITKSYSISIINKLNDILISIWKLMLFYQKENINNNDDQYQQEINDVFQISFTFIHTILKHRKPEIGTILDDKLNDISILIIKLLNLTKEDIDLFINDPNEFIFNEENIVYLNNLRSIIIDVIITILEVRPRTGYYSLLQSANKLSSSSSCKTIFDRESILLIYGYLAQLRYKINKNNKLDFKIQDFLQNIL